MNKNVGKHFKSYKTIHALFIKILSLGNLFYRYNLRGNNNYVNESDHYNIIYNKKEGNNVTNIMSNLWYLKLFNSRRKYAQYNTEWKKQHCTQ